MKNYLAIDTSGGYLSVVAVKDGKAFTSYVPDCAMRQSVLLMDEIDRVLKQAEMTVSDCDFFAAVVGAGSFTGIRIGISAAKGFALACGKPTLPVTSFDVLAYNAIDEKVLCLVDAMHGYYYACGYENGKAIAQPAYLSEAEALALAKTEGYALRAGAPLPIATEVVEPAEGLKKAVGALAEQGAFGELTAVYVRKSSAEENLRQ
ncbi:MAG: tRNA (adenosine(37)-N6)-threonylcarbamoyltransferase complex dimerization subunit type 1 TsaB [Clostridia bacterium]|nr:tRNA (adenosine(37)-N6)-threonylcarbamoyltransferase complex dimerization subunit type 1 TsaB [Clostridia bacterium]